MDLQELFEKASRFDFLSVEEGVFLYQHAPLADLMFVADELRKKQVPHGKVTWQIDRNVNTTNVCIANCKFCNFYRIPGHVGLEPNGFTLEIRCLIIMDIRSLGSVGIRPGADSRINVLSLYGKAYASKTNKEQDSL